MATTQGLIVSLTACFFLAIGAGAHAQSDDSPSSPSDSELQTAASAEDGESEDGESGDEDRADATAGDFFKLSRQNAMIASLTIFVLAIFVGFEVITKVPPTLHTPLMSGSNAISGITIVGALIAAGVGFKFGSFIGMIAVILASINVVGGFLVTHRMLLMFQKKKK